MALTIPSHVAQVGYNKINALKTFIEALPNFDGKDQLTSLEADLHQYAHQLFVSNGGVYLHEADYSGQATTNATSVIVFSGGGPKD